MNLKTACSLLQKDYFVEGTWRRGIDRLIKPTFVFLLSYVILFIGMTLRPNIYDEGIVLTAAMRVAAGQVPHRDFYTLYGPAQYYLLAGLFRLFGESVLVERLFDVLIRALIVTSVYAIVSSNCRRSVAIWTTVLTVLWLFGLNAGTAGAATIPVSLLNLAGTSLVLPVFFQTVSRRRMLVAGIVAGAAAMFRYDTGVALLAIHACVLTIAVCLRFESGSIRLRTFVSAFWPYLLGFTVTTLPPALYYLSVASLRPLVDDFILAGKYYHRGRTLPFPGIRISGLEDLAVYLPIAIIGISIYLVVIHQFRSPGNSLSEESAAQEQQWRGYLIAFGLLALVMYFKGFVRISPTQMYLCTIPSLLLLAMLIERRPIFPLPLRISITCLFWLSVVAATSSSIHAIQLQSKQHSFVLESLISSARGTTPETTAARCKVKNALTRGLCFTSDDDRLQTIEFIDSHTSPDQPLFVGLAKHDRIFANDNLIYFAAQRLPATRWSHFDADLQNREDIQGQMVHELETSAPPYVVRDSEFEVIHEPNDSSISSGVTLLDDYLNSKYRHVETFGAMSVWQRIDSR